MPGKVGMKSNFIIEDDAYRLWLLLMQTRRIMFKARKSELYYLDVAADHSAILSMIYSLGRNATPAEISRILFREPHTVSAVISKLERNGFVTKTKDLKKKLGLNDSALHWDLVNTEKKRVAAHLESGKRVTVYEDGKFKY